MDEKKLPPESIAAKPVIDKPFKTENMVICGECRGNKYQYNERMRMELCPLCNGAGLLHRVIEGSVKLYTIN
jgi:DnaJ-class molecular chaperone